MCPMLLYGDSVRNPNLYYRTGFLIGDPITYFEAGNGAATLVVSGFEKSRAQKQSRIANVKTTDELGYQDVLLATGDRIAAEVAVIKKLLAADDAPLRVEGSFPLLLADHLRAAGVKLDPETGLVVAERRTKNADEIEAIAASQMRAEKAIADAVDILREAVIMDDTLIYRGVPLTAERLRGEIDAGFAKDGFAAEGMIVAPGPGGSDPHWTGAGPIRPHQPIILDIFPQDRSSRYFADVTRTYVKGTPSDEIALMFDTVRRAQSVALDMIRPGVNGRLVHEAVMQTFADAGFADGGAHTARCLHGTGHGVGLEIHELPRLSRVDEELLVGDVVTVEPGLYDPAIGGVRIEDIVVLTESGTRNLNRLPKELVIP
jgi:Xaa-Pro aminopeptidase